MEPEDTWHGIAGRREMAKEAPPSVEQGMLLVDNECNLLKTKAAYIAGSVGRCVIRFWSIMFHDL